MAGHLFIFWRLILMSEWALCVRTIACRRKACGLMTGITETGGHEGSGLQYSGLAQCFKCGRKWDYSRLEGGQAKVVQVTEQIMRGSAS